MAVYQVFKSICQHNSPWEVPLRCLKGGLYQIKKRVLKTPQIIRLFNQQQLVLFPDCPVSSGFIYSRLPDRKEIEWLRQLATPDTVFLDIGAHMGAYSILLSDVVNTIYAFEPHPETFRRLSINFLLNQLNLRHAHSCIVSDQNTTCAFTNNPGSPLNQIVQNAPNALSIASTTLDHFVHRQPISKTQPLLLKIDVEGHEQQVFWGAQHMFKTYNVQGVLFECFDLSALDKIPFATWGFSIQRLAHHNYIAVR